MFPSLTFRIRHFIVVACVAGALWGLGLPLSAIAANKKATVAKADKPGQTPDVPEESLSPLPRPVASKPKVSASDAQSASVAKGASPSPLPPAPDVACEGEAVALCGDSEGRALHLCLGDHLLELSKVCKGALRPYLTAVVRTSCAPDARIECLGVEHGDVVTCLLEAEATTSMPCRSALGLWPRTMRPAASAPGSARNNQASAEVRK